MKKKKIRTLVSVIWAYVDVVGGAAAAEEAKTVVVAAEAVDMAANRAEVTMTKRIRQLKSNNDWAALE